MGRTIAILRKKEGLIFTDNPHDGGGRRAFLFRYQRSVASEEHTESQGRESACLFHQNRITLSVIYSRALNQQCFLSLRINTKSEGLHVTFRALFSVRLSFSSTFRSQKSRETGMIYFESLLLKRSIRLSGVLEAFDETHHGNDTGCEHYNNA
jgi:hypothetical protein